MGNIGRCSIAALLVTFSGCGALYAQDTAEAPARQALHVIGSVTAVDPAQQTISVKADKSGQDFTFTVANTKTLLKVQPGAKDLKDAVRITSTDLQAADRVDVRYMPDDAAESPIPARSVILMSARDLEQAHQAEQQAWQDSTAGVVTNVQPGSLLLNVRVRSAEGTKVLNVQATPATVFTRYSPESPTAPARSAIADIEPGDQVRIIGSTQGDTIQAQRIYSGGFRTIPATIISVDPANNQIAAKNLQTNQTVTVTVTPDTMIRKLPPMMAAVIARRVNGGGQAGAPGAGGQGHGAPSGAGGGNSQWAGGGGGGQSHTQGGQGGASGAAGAGSAPRPGSGDMAKMLEHMPPVALADLKPGDAVVLSVAKGKDSFVASAVVAGVEPIFQSAPPRQGQAFSGGGDWGLDMNIPAQ